MVRTPAPELGEVLIPADVLQRRIAELGAQITHDYRDDPPLLICVLKGAFLFLADLSRAVDLQVEFDFMAVSSYGKATKSSGVVKIVKDLDAPVEGRDVLIVEDIIDSGLTLSYLIDVLERRNAHSVKVVTLFDKPHHRTVELEADYKGFLIPDAFIVGYGLDYAEKYRNLPYVGVLKPEVYSSHA